jgi:hypothetical protein
MHFPDQTARDPHETSETLRDTYLETGDAARLSARRVHEQTIYYQAMHSRAFRWFSANPLVFFSFL